MEQGCGRFLQACGAVVRMLAQDRRYAQRLAAGPGSPGGGFCFDLSDYMESPVLPGVRGEMLQQGRGERTTVSGVAYWSRSNLSPRCRAAYSWGPAEPVPLERFALHEGFCGMEAWPVTTIV
jgi:hypothetical protein